MEGRKDSGGCGGEEDRYRCAAILHPLRRRILRLMREGGERGIDEIAAELDQPPGRIAGHVRVLARRNALAVVPRTRPNPPLYRWSPEAEWARKMLDEIDEQDAEGD
jgi:DNA-binding transcriptional ArsR family regulator